VERRGALISVVVSAACFGTLAVLTKIAYRYGAQPLPLLTWRFAAVAVMLAAWQLVRSPGALKVSAGDVGRYSVLSLTGYGAASMCFFFAVRLVGASVTTVLLYTYPAIVSLIAWVFLGEPFSWRRLAAIGLTFLGCALVADVLGGGGAANPTGIALGLGAALGYAVFNVFSYRWMGRNPRIVLMTYTFGISALGVAAVTLLSGNSLSVAAWTPPVWGLLAVIVLVPTVIAVLLYLRGLGGLGAAQAAIVSTFEPLFTILLAAIVLGERLSPSQWAGAATILAGVVLAEWRPAGPREREAVELDEVAGL
jgi:drug/metabolite transporter (DMT)-like permease